MFSRPQTISFPVSSDNVEYDEYKILYDGLNTAADVDMFESRGYDRRLLETLLTQKTTRVVKKKAFTMKRDSAKLLREWNGGHTFTEIAESRGLPPILVAKTIFEEHGTPRKTFWEYVNDPSKLYSETTAKELTEARDLDLVYSPDAEKRAVERGKWGEGLLWEWLDSQEIAYKTEADRKGEGKTPDCLLDEPMMFKGQKICWIESKASFGDATEFKYNCTHQLIPYTELFGPGVVVYWTGYVDGLSTPDGIRIEGISITDEKLEKIEE